MKVVLCLALCLVAVMGESCNRVSDCHETSCTTDDGWWLHCTGGNCLCSHDTYTGKPCPGGLVSECQAAHGSRCQDHGLNWHCVNNVCHCSKQ